MFERNDKALLTTRTIVIVIIGIFAVLSLVLGIVLAVEIDGVYFLFAFVGWFFCWLAWVFARLYLSYLCDIKLIRNKLYGESNYGLDVFLKNNGEKSNSPVIPMNYAIQNKPICDKCICEKCNSIVEFLDSDIKEERTISGFNGDSKTNVDKVVYCPKCNNRIIIQNKTR